MNAAATVSLLLVFAALHAPANAMSINDLSRGSRATFLTDVEVPAQQEFVVIYERDIENAEDAPQTLACQLHFSQSKRPRALKVGDGFVIAGRGWKKQSLIPGQLPTQTVFLRLVNPDQPGHEFELHLKDSGGLAGQSDFDIALWARRCRIAIEPA